ncbi:MbnP family copper-binding protein [Corallococcus terminator]|uniref:MbnP family copper-binding protein n=1 Tax=Corallococcus terminator TaxID=2316733 RepID=UPI00131555A5|nr:MbnP family copper-binding protein [Corallococcus terminator]
MLAVPALLSACVGERQLALQFAAQVRGEALGCDASYEKIGASGTTLQLLDFKAYVHGVSLVRKSGEKHPLVLEQDGRWQRETVALLDFEDGSGSCNTGSPEMRTEVVGVVPDFDDYTGVEFTIGVPRELNHKNVEWVEPPLDDPSMWWSWTYGYRFLRLDVRSGGNRSYVFHLRADGCTGTPDIGVDCNAENQGTFLLTGFVPGQSRIVFDVAALFAHTDFESSGDGLTDPVPGCLSSADDPECAALLPQVGLGGGPRPTGGADAFIRVE